MAVIAKQSQMKTTAGFLLLSILASFLPACSVVGPLFTNATSWTLAVNPGKGTTESQMKSALAIVDNCARDNGLVHNAEGEKVTLSSQKMHTPETIKIARNYVLVKSNPDESISMIFYYTTVGELKIDINDATDSSNSPALRKLRNEVVEKLSQKFGRQNLRVIKDRTFDFT